MPRPDGLTVDTASGKTEVATKVQVRQGFRQSLDTRLTELRQSLLKEYDEQFGISNGEYRESDSGSLSPKRRHKKPQTPRTAALTPKVSLSSIAEETPAPLVRSTPRVMHHHQVVVHADGDGASPRTKHVNLKQGNSAISLDTEETHSDGPEQRDSSISVTSFNFREFPLHTTASAIFIEDNALQRWHRICSALLRPRGMSQKTARYKLHELWNGQLQTLKKKDPQKSMYLAAISKVRSSRRNSMVQASYSSTLTLNTAISQLVPKKAFMLHPSSTARVAWVLLSCLVFLSDTMLLPVNAFFDIPDSTFIKCALVIGTLFLALDIGANCFTGTYIHGVLEMRFEHVTRQYLKTWMPFDVVLTCLDLLLTVADLVSESLGEVIRTIQVVRLLRLVRLVRLEATLQSAFGLSSKNMLVWCRVVKIIFIYGIYFHVLACVWYGISKTQGKVWADECALDSHLRCYFSCFHWALTQIHGGATSRSEVLDYTTTVEWIFAGVSSFVGFVLLSLFLGTIAHAVAMLTNVDKLEVRFRCIRYTEDHELSSELAHRLLQYVDQCRLQVNLEHRIRQENEILHNLPLALQHDLLFEARGPLLNRVVIFQDLSLLSVSLIKSMCSEALSLSVFMGGEKVFASGDTGTHWRAIDTGGFTYLSAQAMWTDLAMAVFKDRPSLISPKSSDGFGVAQSNNCLHRGQSISEMVLWTSWEHTGDLTATSDGCIIQTAMEAFFDTLKGRSDAQWMVAIYGQQYVKHLSVAQGEVTDLFEYRPTAAYPEEEDSMRHLIFLSHYKAEAGTEATLMQEGLTKLMVRENIECDDAVFLDSEDLANLSDLRDHVVNSRSLVFLLTPGVLLRPWCLVELVTATTYGVQIVPVEIQRPGMTFTYPDETFYSRIRTGKLLPSHDTMLLEAEGITLTSLEAAVRLLFTEIALPFSPHKSKNIRQAELMDIMKRCNVLKAFSKDSGSSLDV